MRAELAIQLAQSDSQDKTLNQVMRRANEIFEASGGSGSQPFPQVDVVFATFVDHLNATGTQRERDLVLASDLLQRVWRRGLDVRQSHARQRRLQRFYC